VSNFTAGSGEGGWGAARADPKSSPGRWGPAMTSNGAGWAVERVTDTVGALHALGLPPSPVRLARWCSPVAPAIVLGRGEPEHHLDPQRVAQRGLEVVRRHSGGGAVLVRPGAQAWVDLVVPRHDPLWDIDVGRANWWVGEAWVRALGSLGVVDLGVHRSALVRRPGSDRICYAGLGPGEVTSGGRKLVGISARRTAAGAVFQCGLLLVWEPEALVDVLALDPVDTPDERCGSRGRSEAKVLDSVADVAIGLRQLVGTNAVALTDLQAALMLALPR
jgi:lipoate-protein ligase A